MASSSQLKQEVSAARSFMDSSKFRIYMAFNYSKYRVGIAQNILLELKLLSQDGYTHILSLSYPLPAGIGYYILNKISTSEERVGSYFHTKINMTFLQRLCRPQAQRWAVQRRLLRGVKRGLIAFKYPTEFYVEEASLSDCQGLSLPNDYELHVIWRLMAGKILFSHEINHRLRKIGEIKSSYEDILQVLVYNGECTMHPGVQALDFGQFRCNRCGETKGFYHGDCFLCGNSHCYSCIECDSMGTSRLCSILYSLELGRIESSIKDKVEMKLSFPMTPAQNRASELVRAFLQEDTPKEVGCLVWAVCGAGKTEVVFSAVEETLNRGGRVLFAIPRRDVVRELEPRIKKAFPTVRVSALYGGSVERDESAELILATTHQAIRFFQAFDLVILDEADAYPYKGSRMLYFALERARKKSGRIVYMTATPNKDLKEQAKRNELKVVTIPARHHGHPLPVPTILKERLTRSSSDRHKVYRIPPKVLAFIEGSAISGAQVFIFVPTIEKSERAGKALKKYFSIRPKRAGWSEWVEYSHSQDPYRAQKCKHFSEGRFPIFVTTTILERGITVRRANVVVLFADKNFIFDQGSLIQMAGRSGRTVEYPYGEVLFVGEQITKDMELAIKSIEDMNEEARRRGYLKESNPCVEA